MSNWVCFYCWPSYQLFLKLRCIVKLNLRRKEITPQWIGLKKNIHIISTSRWLLCLIFFSGDPRNCDLQRIIRLAEIQSNWIGRNLKNRKPFRKKSPNSLKSKAFHAFSVVGSSTALHILSNFLWNVFQGVQTILIQGPAYIDNVLFLQWPQLAFYVLLVCACMCISMQVYGPKVGTGITQTQALPVSAWLAPAGYTLITCPVQQHCTAACISDLRVSADITYDTVGTISDCWVTAWLPQVPSTLIAKFSTTKTHR